MALYNAELSRWRSDDNWGSEKPLSTWFGVSTDEEGRVTELSLPDNRPTLGIPPEIGKLTRLRILHLQGHGERSDRMWSAFTCRPSPWQSGTTSSAGRHLWIGRRK